MAHYLHFERGRRCIPSDMATGSSEEIEEERRLLYVGDDTGEGRTGPHRAAAILYVRLSELARPEPGPEPASKENRLTTDVTASLLRMWR